MGCNARQLACGTTLAAMILTLAATTARADTVVIAERTEGVPTVRVITSTGLDVTNLRVIFVDSAAEFVHFLLAKRGDGSGDFGYTDLFEDTIGGILSDRIIVGF